MPTTDHRQTDKTASAGGVFAKDSRFDRRAAAAIPTHEHLSGERVRTVLSRSQYLHRWQQLHGNYDQRGSAFVRPWLTAMYTLAAPLARCGIHATAVTAAGVVAALVAVGAAVAGGVWLWVAVTSILLSALLDGVDGAVAVISKQDDSWGYVVDSVADRCSDLLFLSVIGLVGGPWPLVAIMMAGTVIQESARARAGAAGMTDTVVLTVWERPSRVITSVLIVAAAAVVPTAAGTTSLLGAIVGAVLCVAGSLQLLTVLRRTLQRRTVKPPTLSIEREGQDPSE